MCTCKKCTVIIIDLSPSLNKSFKTKASVQKYTSWIFRSVDAYCAVHSSDYVAVRLDYN